MQVMCDFIHELVTIFPISNVHESGFCRVKAIFGSITACVPAFLRGCVCVIACACLCLYICEIHLPNVQGLLVSDLNQ